MSNNKPRKHNLKFTLQGFNQLEAIKLGLNNDDLTVLRWFIDFKNTGEMEKNYIPSINDMGHWVNYSTLVDSLPILLKDGNKYLADFFIWDNIGLPKENINMEAEEFTTYILEKLNMVAGVMPTFHNAYKDDEHYKEDFELLQYDMLFGNKYILNENKNKRITIVSHATAISFLIKKWCDIEIINNKLRYSFKNNILLEGHIEYCAGFKLEFAEDNHLINIEFLK